MKKIAFLFLFTNIFLQSFAQSKRTDWFTHDRFGMFIHWGVYSAAEGLWKGEKLRYLNNYAEWIRYRNRISKEEYGQLAKRFVWDKIDPEKWVILAKEAGMKYIIITAKHHDGVAIWDTKLDDYSLPKLSGSHRDIIKELADACRKHGMKLGFYYSHWIDWADPYAWNHNQEITGRVTDAQFNEYWHRKVIPQLTELLTNYGDIALMWFDMWIPYQKSIIKKEQLLEVVQLIRKLQPNCLINSRLGLSTDENNVDFETFGDNEFSTSYVDHPWETPATIADSWGYNGQENAWKSTSQILSSLITNVSLNGGLTLNIGSRADGTVPYESVSRLHDIGKWLSTYGESIYGCTGLPLRTSQHDWGKLTTRKEDNKQFIYAQVFNWPLDSLLRISGITSKPTKITLLPGNNTLAYTQIGPLLHIQLPSNQEDHFVSVIKMEFDQPVSLDSEVVGESTFGGFSLNCINTLTKDFKIIPYDGLRPQHMIINASKPITWKIYIPQKGTYTFDVSVHNPNKEAVQVSILADKKILKASLPPDGKVTVEPNEHNYTDEFTDHRVGSISFDKPGEYEISFQTEGNKTLWLNRIWVNQ